MTTTMRRPFQPEAPDRLAARYPAALAHVYTHHEDRRADQEAFAHGRPGQDPACLFDWPDGLRLIVSREQLPSGEEGIHLSASLEIPSRLYTEYFVGFRTIPDFLNLARARWTQLATAHTAGGVHFEFVGFSQKGVPHWWITTRS